MQWTIRKIRLGLKYTWKISRNESTYKENFIIEANDGTYAGLGEVAPNVRYNETPAGIELAFEKFIQSGADKINTVNDLNKVFKAASLPNALRFGIESALVHLLSKKEGKSISEFLDIPRVQRLQSCYTLPIMNASEIAPFFHE